MVNSSARIEIRRVGKGRYAWRLLDTSGAVRARAGAAQFSRDACLADAQAVAVLIARVEPPT